MKTSTSTAVFLLIHYIIGGNLRNGELPYVYITMQKHRFQGDFPLENGALCHFAGQKTT